MTQTSKPKMLAPKILAIDTSCDETSVAVSEGNVLLSNTLSSSMEFQNEWGGVVPIIAKKNHINRIDKVVKRALKLADTNIKDIDAIAVTYGPGLAVALEVGVAKAKELAEKYNKPLIGVNHMAGHVYANFGVSKTGTAISEVGNNPFPLIVLLISGNHTELVYMKDHLNFEIIGQTLDDSAGEAFDKVARMLRWGYPGGPIIERFAATGDEDSFKFPVAMTNSGDLNFSFSGLKTAVMREITIRGKQIKIEPKLPNLEEFKDEPYAPSISKKPVYQLSKEDSINIAASFQKAVADQLILKSIDAVKKYPVKTFLMGGGVVNNKYIRAKLRKALKKYRVKLAFPKSKKLLTDNAGMIAIVASYMADQKLFTNSDVLDRKPNLVLS